VLRDVGAGVGIARNTPSLLAFDSATGTWFTRVGAATWMRAPAFTGPWAAGSAPSDAAAQAIAAALPPRQQPPAAAATPAAGAAAKTPAPAMAPPDVIVSTTPLCLVSINGQPELVQVHPQGRH
jgi:hypothetical protein